jgi:transcriptional regulator with XRE-family HTH domain
MSGRARFGDFFKQKRLELGLTLREFCRKNEFDPGNISKIERGVFQPPQGEDQKVRYAEALGLRRGSDDWLKFFDYAAAELGRIPDDIQSNDRILAKLPLLFRTVRGADLSEEELKDLIEALKKEE